MKLFELLDISGDAGIRAFGSSLQDLFRNAAAGMYELITDTSSLKADVVVEIALSADTIENALVVFLNELVFRFDTYNFISREIQFNAFDVPEGLVRAENGYRLRAVLRGAEFDPGQHEQRLLIKAATYHRLKVTEQDGTWTAEVIFDI